MAGVKVYICIYIKFNKINMHLYKVKQDKYAF